ncbi:diguanylate cyclase [Persicimonas caeni]|uniref:Diguanylate cyclase n=1 Tax=Persicimonas caeni TaxID=2292766 RepID=A0A4Y6PMW0_PERCE|nr:diguanylate cyclase [Persicimonas caeni]QDG49632.1 diguanylate cyclase [Persicimonas caeni]QED30853.1 diguanylate cyclase [Persicimonas caeni]
MSQTATHDIVESLEIPGVDLLEEVGRGAHSAVYRARMGDEVCAVKVRRHITDADASRHTLRYRTEAAVLARFSHPGLARIIEAGETTREGRPYLIMEFVDGATLADTIDRRGPLGQTLVVDIACTLAAALGEVHRHGVIHRDIKPGNILLRAGDGAVKLIDFGFAARATGVDPDRAVVGTLRYSAPEQTGMLQRPVDARSDLYSLGVVLYECATGRPPFDAAEPAELVRQHAVDKPAPVRQMVPEISPALAHIIEKLLAKDPDDRYGSCAALVADLERLDSLDAAYADGDALELGHREERSQRHHSTPLVGRHRECRRLESAWLQARSGRGNICWLTGVPGAGTSRLVDEFLAQESGSSAFALSVRCAQTPKTPFGAVQRAGENFIRILRNLDPQDLSAWTSHIEQASQEHMPLLAQLTASAFDLPDVSKRFVAEDSGSPTRFAEATASFFLQLATADWPMVFVVDGIEHIDDASLQVLRQVAARVQNHHLLLVLTATEAPDSDSGPEAFLEDVANLPLQHLRIGPLDEEAVSELVASELGGDGLPVRVVRQITARTQGVPLAVREYLFSMLEAGVLRPTRDGWWVDTAGLASLDLPADVTLLMLRRIEELGDEPRSVLRAAAIEGQHFHIGLCSEYSGVDEGGVSEAVAHGIQLRLVEHVKEDIYAFVHRRIRSALADELDESSRRAVHQRIAEVLDDSQANGDAHLFSLARHYANGQVDSNRQRVYETNLHAGLLALRKHAFEEAYNFLLTARLHSPGEVDAQLLRALGEACAATGRVSEAIRLFENAVALASSDVERARLHARIARVYMAVLEMDEAWAQIQLALDHVDGKMPTTTAARGFGTVLAWLMAWLAARFPSKARTHDAAASATMRLRAHLYEIGAITAFFRLDYDLMGGLVIRALRIARRLPDCAEKAQAFSTYGAVLAILGRHATAEEYATRAIEIAEALDDREVLARARWFESTTYEFSGDARRAETLLRQTLREHGLWLELWEYVTVCGELGGLLLDRGFVHEAGSWGKKILERTDDTACHGELVHMERVYGLYLEAAARAWGGKGIEAHAFVEQARRLLEGRVQVGLGEASAVGYELAVHYELGNRGKDVEKLLAKWKRFELVPDRSPHQIRRFYIYQAYLRLDQFRYAREFDQRAARARFLEALDELKLAADTPKYATHLYVIQSDWEALNGQDERAGWLLSRADEVADLANSPWGNFEVALRRARRLKRQGNERAALRRARYAHSLASEYGWSHRARDVRNEFEFYVDPSSSTTTTSRSRGHSHSASEGSTDAQSLKLERYLDSLMEVAIASGTVFDPREQARVALDEIVRIFGAERAFLFGGERIDELDVIAGRDVRGRDLGDRGDYSSSVVERVCRERRSIVSTGSDEGDVLSSASAVHHNLRSIMAGPVQIQDRFLGVVYVDSRIARGVFAPDDAEILMAISSHIGIAQETARAAQLEVDIESERKKRELAEVIRHTTAAMTSTLDQSEVLERLLEGVGQLVVADRAVAFLLDGDQLELFVELGDGGATVGEASEWIFGDPRIERVMETVEPQVSSDGDDLGGTFSHADEGYSWMGVPIVSREQLAGMILLERDEDDAYGPDHVQLALALAGQAGIAIENARLFAQVERLAILDDLTGLPNRRRLFEVAEAEFSRARRYAKPLSAIMLDIDHFKKVNDTYGHAIGDEILRAVAHRCDDALRETDTIGRYGGEEFVVIMPETSLDEASQCVAERLRTAVADASIVTDRGEVSVTISLGVAELTPADEDVDSLLNRADEALYRAKEGGRNRVEVALSCTDTASHS